MRLHLRLAYLDIIVWVPIGVVDNNSVSRGEVNTQTTGSGREEESKLLSTRSCEDEEPVQN